MGITVPIDYSRQKALSDLSLPHTATIVGTGAIGCWVAYFAALSGVQHLLIYSIGAVKPTDIARFPFAPELVGKPYAPALSGILHSIRPEMRLTIQGEFRPSVDDIVGTVFNCAASERIEFDAILYNQCLAAGHRYISGFYREHSAYAVDYYSESLPRPSLDPIPAWAGSAALAGLQILYASSIPYTGTLNRHANLATGRSEDDMTVRDAPGIGR